MNIRPILFTSLGIATIILLIAFVNIGSDGRAVKKVIISIENQLDNHFIDNTDVHNLITNGYTESIEGIAYKDLNVRTLENRVKVNNYVDDAEIFRDLKGNLIINVELRRPAARIIQYDGPDAYIAEDGTLLPVSEKFSSRVLLISGAGTKELAGSESILKSEYSKLFDLVNYINADEFWKAQIAQIDIQKNGDIKLLPQVTKQYIEFGDLNDIKNKFQRLEIFYHDILPRKGWNSYSRVNVKYKNQIICE